ncbi:MAG: hypothetical protein ABIO71_00675 [Caldimonas sp.]
MRRACPSSSPSEAGLSLRELNLRTRRRLRLHAWLLTLWCVSVGLVTSWILLHVFAVRSPAVRYAVAAVFMYSLGLVVGARIWLVRFSQSVIAEPEVLGPATPGDRAVFDSQRAESSRRGSSFDWADLLGNAVDWLSFDEVAAFLIVPAIVVAAFALLLATGALPMLLLDGVANLLAEVAVQFVFGAWIARRVIRPRPHDDAFMSIVGKTWIAGIALVVASAGAGWLVLQVNPGGASIADLFR